MKLIAGYMLEKWGYNMNNSLESPEAAGCSPERLARIKPVMQSYIENHGFAGFSTMLARRGRIINFEQVGCQERETKTELSADTIFRIYSMTKPIICVAFMTLYQEGRFQLFDPVSKFHPAFGKVRVLTGTTLSDAKEVDLIRPVTLHDLLTHTAGLTYEKNRVTS